MKTTATLLLLTSCHVFAADPSTKPLVDPTGQKRFVERHRIIADLDGDGESDLILSGGPATFGSMGGAWTVYLNRDNKFTRVGDITAHPMAISIEPDQARIHQDANTRRFARIWVYLRSSGSAGSFGYYRIGEKTVDKFVGVELYPGDGGTALGNAIYSAAFKKSPIPFSPETSTTDDKGNVRWNGMKR